MIEALSNSLPPELATTVMAALPIVELRGSIPFAIGVLNMSVLEALGWSVLGNTLAAIILLWGLDSIERFSSKHLPWFEKIIQKYIVSVRNKTNDKVTRYGLWALFLFVAIPLPGTGAWTGSVAAYIFGIPTKRAFPIVFVGIVAAGIVVALLTTGIINLL